MLMNRAFLSLFIYMGLSSGLRFGNVPVKIDKSVLLIGESTKLTCDYVRFRSESIAEITWYFEYNGVSGKFFRYEVSTGDKETFDYSFIKVSNVEDVTEKTVEVIIDDYRAGDISIACEVSGMRDNGYGKLRHSRKTGKSLLKIADVRQWSMSIVPHPEPHNRIADPGKPLAFKCQSKGASPPPVLSFTIKGQNLTEIGSGNVIKLYDSEDEAVIQGELNYLRSIHFENDRFLVIKCYAHYGEQLVGQKQFEFTKSRTSDFVPPSNDDLEEESIKRHGDRRGKDSYLDANVINDRILNFMDPARHIHPGIPYDFFNGYIIMMGEKLLENGEADPYTIIHGTVPRVVKEFLTEKFYGRLNVQSDVKIKLRVHPVLVLNILGERGYRVVGSSASSGYQGDGSMVWTLERRNYNELESSSNSLHREL